ncbi:hypothetical protein [Microbacterium sp. CJ88]|uniref:hypothetical protein n=1 Tax=Microbacterium sp. CJ88 TaxID=3445672 RepID=UPI003F65D842
MVTLLLDSTRLEVALSGTERALSFRKGNVFVDRPFITKVQLVDDAWTWLRGVASPGTYIRGAVAMGTWKSAGANDFVLIRRRRPAVVIDLDGDPEFARIVLTTRHGLALVQALRLDDARAQATDVAELAAEAEPVTAPPPRKKRAPRTAPATA